MGSTYTNQRNATLDVMKGLAIIMVVANHASMPVMSWTSLIELPLFFITAGFCYKPSMINTAKQIRTYVLKRIKSLYVPCVLWSAICNLTNNYLVSLGIVDNTIYSARQIIIQLFKCVLFSGGGQLSGTIWFLRCLFFSEAFYVFIDYICKKQEHLRIICCIILSICGWLIGYFKFPGFQYFNCFSVLFCLEIGRLIKQRKIQEFTPGAELKNWKRILIIVITSLALYRISTFGAFSERMNQIENPLMYYTCAILGWLFLCNISYFIGKSDTAKNIISTLGQHTLAIMLFHFLAFKIVTLIEILIFKEDMSLIKSYPCLFTDGTWWLLYTIFGVTIPTILNVIYSKHKLH